MFNIGGGELLIILLVALVVLGPTKLPEAARQVGKVMGEFKKISSSFQTEVREAMKDPVGQAVKKADIADPLAPFQAMSAPDATTPDVTAVAEPPALETNNTAQAKTEPVETADSSPTNEPPSDSSSETDEPPRWVAETPADTDADAEVKKEPTVEPPMFGDR